MDGYNNKHFLHQRAWRDSVTAGDGREGQGLYPHDAQARVLRVAAHSRRGVQRGEQRGVVGPGAQPAGQPPVQVLDHALQGKGVNGQESTGRR